MWQFQIYEHDIPNSSVLADKSLRAQSYNWYDWLHPCLWHWSFHLQCCLRVEHLPYLHCLLSGVWGATRVGQFGSSSFFCDAIRPFGLHHTNHWFGHCSTDDILGQSITTNTKRYFTAFQFWISKVECTFTISDCRDIPFRATLISVFLWIFIFIVGLSFSISTIEVSATYKAMAPYICAAATILLRHPCVSAFAFRANEECRRLDMDEEREKRRNSVIEEAKKARDLRKSKAGILDEDRIERVTETSVWKESE